MKVRPAMHADAPALADIAARSYAHAFRGILDGAALARRGPDHFAERFATDWPRMAVAEPEGRAVGFSLLSGGNVDMLFVDPGEIGRGAGTALLRAAEAAGADSLECFRDNAPARAFYESRGWRVASAYRREFAGDLHEFVLYRPGKVFRKPANHGRGKA